MNRRGEVNFVAIIVSALTVGLFFSLLGAWVYLSSDFYDVSGNEIDELRGVYDRTGNITDLIDEVNDEVEAVTVNPSLFDYFSGIFSKLLSPFKSVANGFKILLSLIRNMGRDLLLLPFVTEFLVAVLSVVVVVGLIMLRGYLNKR